MPKWRRLPRIFLNQPESSSITMDLPRSTSGSATTITDLPQSITTAVWQPTYIFLDHHESSWTITSLHRPWRIFLDRCWSSSIIADHLQPSLIFLDHHGSCWIDYCESFSVASRFCRWLRVFFIPVRSSSIIMRLPGTIADLFFNHHVPSSMITSLRRRSCVFFKHHASSSMITSLRRRSRVLIDHHGSSSIIMGLHRSSCVFMNHHQSSSSAVMSLRRRSLDFIDHLEYLSTIMHLHQSSRVFVNHYESSSTILRHLRSIILGLCRSTIMGDCPSVRVIIECHRWWSSIIINENISWRDICTNYPGNR